MNVFDWVSGLYLKGAVSRECSLSASPVRPSATLETMASLRRARRPSCAPGCSSNSRSHVTNLSTCSKACPEISVSVAHRHNADAYLLNPLCAPGCSSRSRSHVTNLSTCEVVRGQVKCYFWRVRANVFRFGSDCAPHVRLGAARCKFEQTDGQTFAIMD